LSEALDREAKAGLWIPGDSNAPWAWALPNSSALTSPCLPPVHQVFAMHDFVVMLCESGRAKITEFQSGISKTWQNLMSGIELFAN